MAKPLRSSHRLCNIIPESIGRGSDGRSSPLDIEALSDGSRLSAVKEIEPIDPIVEEQVPVVEVGGNFKPSVIIAHEAVERE